ncbi:uncharacterized protein LOC119113079 [Pollicipes pollicipes]|uniref:uncharacterized protein LOC119113079 n=1 Tax=Pollicipes pollicipes TaxID=41117 RepID=UPI0018849769|nr:uncharacterized protein LOC119113079 [Pollicipes pollicipes]
MAAVGKLKVTESHHMKATNVLDLIMDTNSAAKENCGLVPEKANFRKATSDPRPSANNPNRDACDLVRETGGLATISCDLAPETKNCATASSHLAIEMEALQAALKQKDLLISSLQSQLLAVCQSRSSREAERAARERERALLLERSVHLQQQIDRRRAHVKNARITLEQIDTTERNIDDCIRRAELEYHLETEELNILNLQGEHMRLKSRLEGAEDSAASARPISLSSCLPSHGEVSLHPLAVPYDPGAPCFTLTQLGPETGVQVEWAHDHCGLRSGDRLLEVNGQS